MATTAPAVSTTRRPGQAELCAATLGAAVWIIAVVVLRPAPVETAWARLLLLLAPLVLVPLGVRLVAAHAVAGEPEPLLRVVILLQLPAALLLGSAFLAPQGLLAAALSLPWLAATVLMAVIGSARAWRHRRGPLWALCLDAALIYVAVGGVWTVLDRLGVRPLEFEGVIVLLTAIHFHYAGFALPLLTGLAVRDLGGWMSRLAGVGVVAAVPLVAVGITATQLGLGPILECLASCLLAGAGVLTGFAHARLAVQSGWPRVARALWAVAGVSLVGSMALAALYGLRFYVSVTWLDIPWMRAVHGTANALGFALAGVVGWSMSGERRSGREIKAP